MTTYDLMFTVPEFPNRWYRAAADCDWNLLLGMVRLWKETNPQCQLQAIRHTEEAIG